MLGCTGALLLRFSDRGKPQISAATDPALMKATLQIAAMHEITIAGQALSRHRAVLCNDLSQDVRWAGYTRHLASVTPIRSVLAFPISLHQTDFGVLTVYSDQVGFFTPTVCDLASDYADVATIALAGVIEHDQATNMASALQSNRDIGVAVGILMTSHKISQDAAFDRLHEVSQNGHRKLRSVADEVILTGELPKIGPWRPGD